MASESEPVPASDLDLDLGAEPDPAPPNGRSTKSPMDALRNRRGATPAEPLRLADLPKSEHRRAVLTCAAGSSAPG